MKKTAISLIGLLVLGAGAVAAAEARYWEHKDWRAIGDRDMRERYQCRAMTGGDGSDSFQVLADTDGNVSVFYAEATARGYGTNLKDSQAVRFVVTGRSQVLFEDTIDAVTGVDPDGIPFANAGPADGDAAALIGTLRAGSTLRVEREVPGAGRHELLGEFSLSGFTAAFLKISEWCGFAPELPGRS